jgi:hypothetical protein
MSKDNSQQKFETEEDEKLTDEFPLVDQVMQNLAAILETSGVMEHVIKPIRKWTMIGDEDD